jgi:hypothetical protein
MMKGPHFFEKRKREQAKQEKLKQKAERKAQRRAEKGKEEGDGTVAEGDDEFLDADGIEGASPTEAAEPEAGHPPPEKS